MYHYMNLYEFSVAVVAVLGVMGGVVGGMTLVVLHFKG
jgi:hypothetical protein